MHCKQTNIILQNSSDIYLNKLKHCFKNLNNTVRNIHVNYLF